jgi:hypothetical protein
MSNKSSHMSSSFLFTSRLFSSANVSISCIASNELVHDQVETIIRSNNVVLVCIVTLNTIEFFWKKNILSYDLTMLLASDLFSNSFAHI